jgi:hypothetical protein
MDWFLKIMMGGWLPQGKRSQWTAAAVAAGAILVALVQWASGDMGLIELVKLVTDKWPVFAAAFYGYFMAEKVDAKA